MSLALIRATSKDDTVRDGQQAVELATRACELAKHENPEALYALAAAYAEVGRFTDAASTAEAAIRAALAAGNQRLAETIQPLPDLCRQRTIFQSDSR